MKKKGLLISTIVMVVVLVASLTTATYAWFSATAAVSVENISITTTATKGLEIAVKTDVAGKTGYVNGDLTWDGTNFDGTDGWGAAINFDAITNKSTGKVGIWEDAVAVVTKSGDKYMIGTTDVTNLVFKAASVSLGSGVSGYYMEGKNASGATEVGLITSGTQVAVSDTSYYTKAVAGTDFKAGDYLLPIGYNTAKDGTVTPFGYVKATENKDYMNLPISIRPSVDVAAIVCKITINPDQNEMTKSAYMPGMAAASRIILKPTTSGTSLSGTTVEPYSTITTEVNGFSGTTTTEWTYNFVIAYAYNNKVISANTVYDFDYTIWIEGTDGQCVQATTGSAFGVKLDFDYLSSDNKSSSTSALSKVTVNSVDYNVVAGVTTAINA